jgi:hypothetical protein
MYFNPFKGKNYKIKLLGYLGSISFFLSGILIKAKAIHTTHNFSSKNIYSGNWFIATSWRKEQDNLFNIPNSNRLLQRDFTFLGRIFNYENIKISWHFDPVSQKTWQKKYFKLLYPVASPGDSSDCKMPWELSRFQHLPSMAKAYIATEDMRFVEEALRQIDDWIDENPCPYGINWTCAMEVSIRACNWMWAWWAFKDKEVLWTTEFHDKFLRSMWQHGWYIEKNLENKGGIETNHYLADIVGLLFIGVMFPQFKDAEKWKKLGIKEITRCMEEMVYEDGVSFENSTAYQRLVLELFTYSAILCKNNNIDLPSGFWNRLERMFEFILHAMRPDGVMPMVGDNDDGRFFILSDYYNWDRWDFRYLLSIGAALFYRHDLKVTAGEKHEEIDWLFTEKEIKDYGQL